MAMTVHHRLPLAQYVVILLLYVTLYNRNGSTPQTAHDTVCRHSVVLCQAVQWQWQYSADCP